MINIAIVTDSAADLPKEYCNYPNLRIVPLSVTFSEGTYFDGEEIDAQMFYEKMANSKTLPFTSQPTPEQFYEAYQAMLAQYEAVLSIHLSAELSGTMNSARLGLEMLSPAERSKVHIFDSGAASLVEGLMVITALEMVASGSSLPEILQALQYRKAHQMGIFMVDTLENLMKGGRIGHLQSLLGTLLKLKPLLYMGYDSAGKIQTLSKVRGRKKAWREMVNIMKKQAPEIHKQRIAIVHSFAPDISDFEQLIKQELNPQEIIVTTFGAVIGTHTGKNAIAVCFMVNKE